MKKCIVLCSFVFMSLFSCEKNPVFNRTVEYDFEISKWYQNHAAAISITYDSGSVNSEKDIKVQQLTLSKGLRFDYELVTAGYLARPDRLEYLMNTLIPNGISYFGHGHTHINHDALSYEEAYNSFKLCYDTMLDFGLKPVAYGYPGGFGHEAETQMALAEVGFLCGRMHSLWDVDNPYIVPNEEEEPPNWYHLPSLVMQDYDYKQLEMAVNNTEELIPILDGAVDRNAWIILTYHSIGDTTGYGFFRWEEYEKNLDEIAKRDFWNASMNDIVLYILEKKNAIIKKEEKFNLLGRLKEIQFSVDDSLDNLYYDIPLSLFFTVPEEWHNKVLYLFQENKLEVTINPNGDEILVEILPDGKTHSLTINNNIS